MNVQRNVYLVHALDHGVHSVPEHVRCVAPRRQRRGEDLTDERQVGRAQLAGHRDQHSPRVIPTQWSADI